MDDDDDHYASPDEEKRLEGLEHDTARAGGGGMMDDEAQEFDISEAGNKLWLVKIPGFLMDRWSTVEQAGLELGVLRIYKKPGANGQQKIKLLLPKTVTDVPREYDLSVNDPSVKNTYIFQETSVAHERPIDPAAPQQQRQQQQMQSNRAPAPVLLRSTRLLGTVHHECAVQPTMNDAYRTLMRRRQAAASAPKRSTQMLKVGEAEASAYAARGGSARIGKFNFGFIDAKAKGAKRNVNERGERDVAVRIPKNELLDKLFDLFQLHEYWNLRGLRVRTAQPEQYLREVLQEIAILNKRGEYTNLWALKPEYKTQRPAAQAQASAQASSGPRNDTMTLDSEDDDDDDMDDDMDEVG